MSDDDAQGYVLYERRLATGPCIRIRRTTDEGRRPVVGVLEVERRISSPRTSRGGVPPYLLQVEGVTDDDVLTSLLPFAENDATVSRLMQEHGLR